MGMGYFRYWHYVGVQIDVLTNAYAAATCRWCTPEYANYRIPLLETGVTCMN